MCACEQQGILNAYYFPGQDYHSLYPNITPVNSYRVIFNQFFNRIHAVASGPVLLLRAVISIPLFSMRYMRNPRSVLNK